MALLSVIVPAFNEARNIPGLVERVASVLAGVDYELVIVDDGSVDGTAAVAGRYVGRYPVRVVRLMRNRGKVYALLVGVAVARGVYVAFLDADMEYPPEALPVMLRRALEGFDVVVGARVDARPFHRRVVSSGSRLLAKLLLPGLRRFRDPTTELVLARRDLVLGAGIRPSYIKPFLPVLLAAGRPFEVSVRLGVRSCGRSSFRARWVLLFLYEVLDLVVRGVRG